MNLKRTISFSLCLSIFLSAILPTSVYAEDKIPKKFSYVADLNISQYDFKNSKDIIETYSFFSKQKWPEASKMPDGFDPQALLEWGKDPGLNVRKLNEQGYKGRGVNIAYIDQPLLLDHIEYKDQNINYYMTEPGSVFSYRPSYHGPGMLSILSGKTIGVAPEANVYFFGTTAWEGQSKDANALYELIKVNNTLPDDEKIKVVGISDFVSTAEPEPEQFAKAIEAAEASGIMVITSNSYFNVHVASIDPYKDKNDYNNYVEDYNNDGNTGFARLHEYIKMQPEYSIPFYIPGGSRTTADGSKYFDWNGHVDAIMNEFNDFNPNENFVYHSSGGRSNCVPYITGVIALGLQIDPNLTKEEIINYMYDSANTFLDGVIINPEGFIELVKVNCENPKPIDKTSLVGRGLQQKKLVDYTFITPTDHATGIVYGMQDYERGYGLKDFDLSILMAAKVGDKIRFYYKHNFDDISKVKLWIQNDTDTYRKCDTIDVKHSKISTKDKSEIIEIPINKLLKTGGISFGFITNNADGSINGSVAAHINTFANDYSSLSSNFTATLNMKGKIVNGSTLIPMRALFEILDYEVTWNQTTKSVEAVNKNISKAIHLSIDDNIALVDGKVSTLPVAPQLIDNSTYIPLRFVSEASGHQVEWNNETKEAKIIVKFDKDSDIVYTVKTK